MLIGVIYFVVYYVIFSFLIKKLNIMTPGREPEPDVDSGRAPTRRGPAPDASGSPLREQGRPVIPGAPVVFPHCGCR